MSLCFQEEIEASKKEWELGHLKSLKEEEERATNGSDSDQDDILAMSREEACQVNNRSHKSRSSSKSTKNTDQTGGATVTPKTVSAGVTTRKSRNKLNSSSVETKSAVTETPKMNTRPSNRSRRFTLSPTLISPPSEQRCVQSPRKSRPSRSPRTASLSSSTSPVTESSCRSNVNSKNDATPINETGCRTRRSTSFLNKNGTSVSHSPNDSSSSPISSPTKSKAYATRRSNER